MASTCPKCIDGLCTGACVDSSPGTPKPRPNPGSLDALNLGCECPVLDNHYGQGLANVAGPKHFWVNGACPVHGLGRTA